MKRIKGLCKYCKKTKEKHFKHKRFGQTELWCTEWTPNNMVYFTEGNNDKSN